MKVIDLLTKMANGEVPEKIKYESYIYWYDKDLKDYKNAQVEYRSYLINCKYHNTDFLNDEVEVIEDTPKEDNKIEKLDLQYKDIIYNPNFNANILMYCDNLQEKLNEIIDKINGE